MTVPFTKIKVIHWLVLGAALVSLIYSFGYRIQPQVDAYAYDQIALHLLEGQGFKENAMLSYEFDPGILRAGPGYEFFLAGIYALFGHHYEAVWIIQALLHAATVYLMYRCARLLFVDQSETIGLVAAALIGFHPDLIEISAMLMTETLYLFFVVLTIFVFLKSYYDVKNSWLALILGGVTGLAILTRPTVILFIPVFLFLYWRKRAWRPLVKCGIGLLVALSPWVVRNYLVYDQFILTTLIGSFNLWVGNTLHSNGGQLAGGFNPITNYVSTSGLYGLNQKATEEFFLFLGQHPFIFIQLCLIRLVRYFSIIRPMGFWFYQTGLTQMIFILSSALGIMVLFVSGFTGMVLAFKKRQELYTYVLILALTAPFLLLLTVVQSRYRFQIYPFLALFGGYLFVEWKQQQPCARHIFLWIIGILVCIGGIDGLLFFSTIFERLQNFFH